MSLRFIRAVALAAVLVTAPAPPLRAAGNLNIYFIDVEGGQATLIVTPSGQSLLVDTGYSDPPGRDARRILAAAKDAQLSKIDYLLITHFHADHIGGLSELEKHIEIGTIFDHDKITGSDASIVKPFNQFIPARRKIKQHIVTKVGDRIPLADVETMIVSNGGSTLTKPLDGVGGRNAACSASPQAAHDVIENPRSTGLWLQFGHFRFLDLGDLTGKPLYSLACPIDMIGNVDVYLVPHHGNDDVTEPGPYAAFKPRVAIVNNGENKGGGQELLAALHKVDGLEDVWQLHRSTVAGSANFPDGRIANLSTSSAHWIKLSARDDGAFTVTNGRSGATKSYAAR